MLRQVGVVLRDVVDRSFPLLFRKAIERYEADHCSAQWLTMRAYEVSKANLVVTYLP